MDVDASIRQAPKRGLVNNNTRNNKHSKLHSGKHLRPKIYSNIRPGTQVLKVTKEYVQNVCDKSVGSNWANGSDLKSTYISTCTH